ncbi:MAG: dihydroorotase [Candidatus Omnitrophica bacterium]|nr:dihydroorotase [Candidatus Omnitrophota bacterium]
MGKLLIKNGRVVDPANKVDAVRDVLAENGRIAGVAENIRANSAKVIDAAGKIVLPGLVDMHVHLREPGREDKETVASGTKAALKGGVTSVLAMPNTTPSIDSAENVSFLKEIIKSTASANVFIAAAITKGREGKELTDIAELKKLGIAAITDDGSSLDPDKLMLEALKKAKANGMLAICHCEDKKLSNHGCVNSGIISTRMGLKGISRESEYKRVERDIDLAAKAGSAVHIAHISCRESVEMIRRAKKNGAKVTCDVTPHHFSLTEEAVLGFDANFKMNPPLRSKEDVSAIREGLRDGTIDAIASDHAPHTENEKEIEFERAEFGVIGLETELAAAITELLDQGILDWPGLVEKMALNPARILGIDKGTLSIGRDADIVIVDPDKAWIVRREGLVSKSKNCAFLGRELKGAVEYTICSGKVAYGIHS